MTDGAEFKMMGTYTDVVSQVEYNLEKIDPNRKIEVSLKDFLYLYNVIDEFVRFFHEPMHYETLEDINHLLCEVYYTKFQYRDVLPKDIQEMIDNSEFENPNLPYYQQL